MKEKGENEVKSRWQKQAHRSTNLRAAVNLKWTSKEYQNRNRFLQGAGHRRVATFPAQCLSHWELRQGRTVAKSGTETRSGSGKIQSIPQPLPSIWLLAAWSLLLFSKCKPYRHRDELTRMPKAEAPQEQESPLTSLIAQDLGSVVTRDMNKWSEKWIKHITELHSRSSSPGASVKR